MSDTLSAAEEIPAVEPFDACQEKCWNLLRRRYPPQDLVYLPSTMGGDYGIEGYSTDGIAYQCYADRDSLNLRERTDKQKQKLLRDTNKLLANAPKFENLLRGSAFQYYFLLVPQFHAADLVVYAAKRSETVRGWGLTFIASDFSIRIKTPDDLSLIHISEPTRLGMISY